MLSSPFHYGQKFNRAAASVLVLLLALVFSIQANANEAEQKLRREINPKPTYTTFPSYLNTLEIVVKFEQHENVPTISGQKFASTDPRWTAFNTTIAKTSAIKSIDVYFPLHETKLQSLLQKAKTQLGENIPDLAGYYTIRLDSMATPESRLAFLDEINQLEIVEIAYFPSFPLLPEIKAATPNFQTGQFYLNPAPQGVDAYYAWSVLGGKGDNIKVIDIEGNWVEHHEDLHGGTDSFHIGGAKLAGPTYYHHGTAVLGVIASDSNSFGTTGIAFNANLGTVGVGANQIAAAITMAAANSDVGDIILIEFQIAGPLGAAGVVPPEWEQANFDAILIASAAGRIIVEAGANGGQNLDDVSLYGQLFNPAFRFSGAIIVGAATPAHVPESFSNYGQRVDVHGFGEQVTTLGYGNLYGSDTTNFYTNSFAGTSSASPIVTGACAVLQGVQKATYGTVLDHNEMRSLLQTYSTPQTASQRQIGPMPNLRGSVDAIFGVSFSADTVFGNAPFEVNFSAASGLIVDTWTWSFGDGDSAFIQNPTHTYAESGIFDIGVAVTSGSEIKNRTRASYIAIVADTIHTTNVGGDPNSLVEVIVNGKSTVPVKSITIGIDLTGTLGAALESFSTIGCRTEFMGLPSVSHLISADSRFTLTISTTSLPLSPGDGPLMKLYFRIPSSGTPGQTTHIDLNGYSEHLSEFSGQYPLYRPVVSGLSSISVCDLRGDLNHTGSLNVLDLNMMVSYIFNGGATPNPLGIADVNCTGNINILDLNAFVAYVFSSGPSPCSGC